LFPTLLIFSAAADAAPFLAYAPHHSRGFAGFVSLPAGLLGHAAPAGRGQSAAGVAVQKPAPLFRLGSLCGFLNQSHTGSICC
jgi:hypothetical protein